MMRLLYGVHGYGQGHATRALSVLPELKRRHEVLVLAGGDAYEALSEEFKVIRIPTLGYSYLANGKRSAYLTLKENLPGTTDLFWRGPTYRMVESVMQDFGPDAVISDAEPWTHRAAERLGIFRIGFDHFGIMAHCRPPLSRLDRILSFRDVWAYRRLMGQPQRVLVSSFYDAPPARSGVRQVSTLLRPAVFEWQARRGEHLLAYFNKGVHLFSKRIEDALRTTDLPVVVYGAGRIGSDGNLEFRPRGNRTFLEALASCRAVISTAGNQLAGEAIYFGKPMLVTPENCVEQRMNALAVVRLGIGDQVRQKDFSVEKVRAFLEREDEYRRRLEGMSRDGRQESVEAIENMLTEIGGDGERRKAAYSAA